MSDERFRRFLRAWRFRRMLFRNRLGNAWLAFRHGIEACEGCGAALAESRDEAVNAAQDAYRLVADNDQLRSVIQALMRQLREREELLAVLSGEQIPEVESG